MARLTLRALGRSCPLSLPVFMTSPIVVLGPEFEQWRSLTDDYEHALQAMQRGEFGARERVHRLAKELVRLSAKATARPIPGRSNQATEPRRAEG